nr:MAG: glycoprotein [Adumi ohlsrhavirus]
MSPLKLLYFVTSMTFALTKAKQNTMLLFPVSEEISFHPVSASSLVCPIRRMHDQIESGIPIVVRIPNMGRSPSIAGSLCTAIELVTTCEKGFFGGTTITEFTNAVNVEEARCRITITSHYKGDFLSLEHPTPVCSWMRTSTNTKRVEIISSHPVHYDPYTNILHSSIFLGGKCLQAPCLTIFANKLWIPEDSKSEFCSEKYLDLSYLIAYNDSDNQVKVWSSDIDVYGPLPCIMTFCGKPGLRFSNGNWVGLDKKNVPKLKWILDYFNNVIECIPGTTINIIQAGDLTKNAVSSLTDELIVLECEAVRGKILEGNPVSRAELQTFIPEYPGLYPVYHYSPGRFTVGTSYYKWLYARPSLNYPYVEFYDIMNKTYHWTKWTTAGNSTIIDGPNGLYILNKTLIYSLDDIMKYKTLTRLSSHQIFPLESENNSTFIDQLMPESDTTYQFADDKSVSDLVSGSYFYYLIYVLISLVICLVAIRIMKSCFGLIPKAYNDSPIRKMSGSEQECETAFFNP